MSEIITWKGKIMCPTIIYEAGGWQERKLNKMELRQGELENVLLPKVQNVLF